MIESLSMKFESCGIPFFRFRTLNFLSNFCPKSSKLKDRLSKKLDKNFNVLKLKKGIPQLSNLEIVIHQQEARSQKYKTKQRNPFLNVTFLQRNLFI